MTTSPRLIALDGPGLLTELATFIIAAQDKAFSSKEYFDIAISGGSQASTIADALLKNPKVQWDKWRVWLADERIVPLDHEDSNWYLFKINVMDKLPKDKQPTGFTLSEDLLAKIDSTSHEEFANDYQNRLIAELGDSPVLDVALLGMGPDGHTCSLFPGHPLLNEKKKFVASLDDSPKPPPKRITLTKPALALVDKIIFIATGASKLDALHRIFNEEDESLPTKQVIDASKNQVIFLTDPAALGH